MQKKSNIIMAILIIISFTLLFISKNFFDVKSSIIFLSIFFTILCIDALLDIKKKYLLLLFYGTFFLFTMGQYYFPLISKWFYYTSFSDFAIQKTILLQGISLLSIYVGHELISHFKKAKYSESKVVFNPGKVILVASFFLLLSIVVNLETGFRVLKYGYLVIYNNEVASFLPSVLVYIASATPLVFIFALSMLKEKKYQYVIIFYYLIYLVYTLLTGVRGEFGIGIILIVIYIFVIKFISGDYKFNLKKIMILGALSVILIGTAVVGLNVFNSVRSKQAIGKISIKNEISDFFASQGSSVNLIALGVENKEQFTSAKAYYTFGPMIENVSNKLSKLDKTFAVVTNVYENYLLKDIKYSTSKYSYALVASTILLGEDGVSEGQGVGTQYIAELYVDYDIPGVVIYSLLLGMLMYFVSNFYKYGPILKALSLFEIQIILYLPRGQAIQPINSLLSFNLILIILIVFMITKYKEKKYV